ncbi:hypothetical protein FQZ97_893900 [compost metagenome]
MQGAALAGEVLGGTDALAQVDEMFGRRQGRRRQGAQFGQRLFQGFHAAEAAAGGAGQVATLFLQGPEGAVADIHLGMQGDAFTFDLNVIDLVDGMYHAVAQAEAGDEVLQVAGRDHHHGVADAIEGDGQGTFLGQDGVFHMGIAVQFGIGIAGRGGRGIDCGEFALGVWACHGSAPATD